MRSVSESLKHSLHELRGELDAFEESYRGLRNYRDSAVLKIAIEELHEELKQ